MNSEHYFGPDRRRKRDGEYSGPDRRRTDQPKPKPAGTTVSLATAVKKAKEIKERHEKGDNQEEW